MTGWGVTRCGTFKAGAAIVSICCALACFSSAGAAGAGESLYRFALVPGWVKAATPEYEAPPPAGGVSNGTWNLLFDRQLNVTPDGDDYYQHSAVKVISSRGVDNQSQFNISVDPTYQSLHIHSLRVVRQGHAIDQRPAARITALPQETELRDRIYNGGYNINILLADVRVGDVIEYDYTLHSRERVFPGVFSTRMSIGWSSPVRWQRVRILSPANRELFYRASTGERVPAASLHGGVREFEWEWRDLAGIPADDDRPRWYSTWPNLEVSDSRDWSGVARRLAPLFEVKQPLAPALVAVVNDIRNAGGPPAEQALHALQFVQEQIRYVSISIGPGAFQPASPATVLGRRFGDCKDKSLLLATLLRELGIEARPALVNTRRGRMLDSVLPTPYTFDHAIVRMQLGNDVFWLDGTTDTQFSPLSPDSPADFERALVIDRGTTGLTTIPRAAPGVSSKTSEVVMDLRGGRDKPAKLQIATFYRGRLADTERRELADDSPEQRQTNYVNYIASYYPGAKTSAPLTIHDDRAKNVVEVREYYELDKPFTQTDSGRPQVFLHADEIYRYVNTLKSSVRRAPLAIDYPVQVQQTVRAILPGKWPVSHETVRVDNPVFRYQSTVNYSEVGKDPEVTLEYRYESLADSVAVAALPRYQGDRKRAYDDLGYYIRLAANPVPPAKRPAVAPVPRLVALLALIAGVWIALRLMVRWDPAPATSERGWPAGIRGWLLVPAFSALVSPVILADSLSSWARFLDVEQWTRLHATVAEPYKAWAPAILLVFTTCGVLLLVGHAVLLHLFLRKRSSAPPMFIAIHWASVVYAMVLSAFLVAAHLSVNVDSSKLAGELLGGVVRVGIYTAYLLQSRRVKATYVVRRPANAPRQSALARSAWPYDGAEFYSRRGN
jgi:transglutaminase-like putative cysteine protease